MTDGVTPSPGWCHKMRKTQSLPRHPLPMPGLSLSSRQHDEDRARLQGCGGMSQTQTGEKGLLELQIGCVRQDSLAFEPDTVPGWQGCHCSSGRCRGSLGHTLKEGKCCRNCLPEYLTLQLCTQLNTQISEEPLPQAVMPRHLKMSAITGLGNGGTR